MSDWVTGDIERTVFGLCDWGFVHSLWDCVTGVIEPSVWDCVTGEMELYMWDCVTGDIKRSLWDCVTGVFEHSLWDCVTCVMQQSTEFCVWYFTTICMVQRRCCSASHFLFHSA
jgi:RNAse (barnase) inhibitor barstar